MVFKIGTDLEKVKAFVEDKLSSPFPNNLKTIKNEVEGGTYGGKFCSQDGALFYLVGATSTDEDYYYIGITEKLVVRFYSCVGRLQVVEDAYQDPNLSVLIWMLDHDEPGLLDRVTKELKEPLNTTDVLFTKIVINGHHYDLQP